MVINWLFFYVGCNKKYKCFSYENARMDIYQHLCSVKLFMAGIHYAVNAGLYISVIHPIHTDAEYTRVKEHVSKHHYPE